MMKSKYSITVKVHLTEKVPFQEPRMQQKQEAIRWYPATLQIHHASLCGLFQPFRKARLEGVLWILLCKRRMLRDIEHHFGQDLQDYAKGSRETTCNPRP
jgi:hypothetical protein